jgi:hypothetical protein
MFDYVPPCNTVAKFQLDASLSDEFSNYSLG